MQNTVNAKAERHDYVGRIEVINYANSNATVEIGSSWKQANVTYTFNEEKNIITEVESGKYGEFDINDVPWLFDKMDDEANSFHVKVKWGNNEIRHPGPFAYKKFARAVSITIPADQ